MRYLARLEPWDRESWLLRAVAEAPNRREGWVELAQHYYKSLDWPACYLAATRALRITEKPLEYLCEDFAWGSVPLDLAALSAYYMGLSDQAATYGAWALEADPGNERLATNLGFYLGKAS